jgi:hypothetical protein
VAWYWKRWTNSPTYQRWSFLDLFRSLRSSCSVGFVNVRTLYRLKTSAHFGGTYMSKLSSSGHINFLKEFRQSQVWTANMDFVPSIWLLQSP